MNLSELLTYTRDLLAGEGDQDTWSDAQLLRFINASIAFLYARKLESDPDVFVEYATFEELGMSFTKRSDFWETRIPDHVVRIRQLEYAEGEGHLGIRFSSLNSYGSGMLWGNFSNGGGDEWFLAGDRRLCVGADPNPSKLRMWYARRPAPLFRFEATGGSTTTITLSVNALGTQGLGDVLKYAGAYVGSWVEITSASNAEPEGERAKIVTYAKSTYPTFTMTLDTTLSGAVGSGDVCALAPNMLDEFHHELIAYSAAIRALDREGNIEHKHSLQETSRDLWTQFLQNAENRQDQYPRHAFYTDRGDT